MSAGFRLDAIESWLRSIFGSGGSAAGPTDALAWDDLLGTESQGAGGAALAYDVIKAGCNFKVFSFANAASDELHLRYQIGHGWRRGTSAKMHLHYSLASVGAGTADFSGEYCWVPTGSVVPDLASWTPFAAPLTTTGVAANTLGIHPLFTATAPAAAKESSFLLVYLKRTGITDSYNGSVQVWGLDAHIQLEKFGTESEIPT